MGFITSVLNQGVRIPLRLNSSGLVRFSPLTPFQHQPLFLSKPSIPLTSFLVSSHWKGQSPYARRSTKQKNFYASEETERKATSQPRGDTKNVDNSTSPLLEHDMLSSVRTVALWVSAAVAFGVILGMKDGVGKASEFFAGYLLEQSLSVDNLFVFVLIFKYFKVPVMYQGRVLSYGIAGAIIFRASMILLGTATLQRFEVVNLLLASILLYSSYKIGVLALSDEVPSTHRPREILELLGAILPASVMHKNTARLS